MLKDKPSARNSKGIKCSIILAGLDEMIKLWDLRNTTSPIVTYHGHVSGGAGRKLKRIHRPTLFLSTSSSDSFILSGGENSHAISLFQLRNRGLHDSCSILKPVFSRGKLPLDVGRLMEIMWQLLQREVKSFSSHIHS